MRVTCSAITGAGEGVEGIKRKMKKGDKKEVKAEIKKLICKSQHLKNGRNGCEKEGATFDGPRLHGSVKQHKMGGNRHTRRPEARGAARSRSA